MKKRTLEQFIKFDCNLPIGRNAVSVVRRDGSTYPACVEITARGSVYIIRRPTDSDIYNSWHRVKGDKLTPGGTPIVWGARNPDLLKMFDNPITFVDLRRVP